MMRFVFGLGLGMAVSQGSIIGVVLLIVLHAGLELADYRLKQIDAQMRAGGDPE